MSNLMNKLKEISTRKESTKKESASRPARVNTYSSIKPKAQTKPEMKIEKESITMAQILENNSYSLCTVAYTKDFRDFRDIYDRMLCLELKELESTKLDGITVEDSGEIPNDYLQKLITNPKISFYIDSFNETLILQHPTYFQVFYNKFEDKEEDYTE